MARSWKPLEDWDIAWRSDQFFRARVKLTAWYVGFVLIILAFFSVVLYSSFSRNIHDGDNQFRRNQPQLEDLHDQFADDAASTLLLSLYIVDGIVFLVAIAASYWFAGYTLRPIKDSVTAQKRFVANASHELRTPLAIAQTEIEVLLRQKQGLPAEAEKTLKSSLEELAVMKKLSSQLINLSKAGNISKQNQTKFDLSENLSELIARMEVTAKVKDIRLEKNLQSTVLVKADPEQVQHIFSNIIENAIKYSDSGRLITVKLQKVEKFAVVEITDQGQGISEKDLVHIYEPFYKADKAHNTEGAGLGLSIVKTLLLDNRGSIDIESKEAGGTKVVVKLPLA